MQASPSVHALLIGGPLEGFEICEPVRYGRLAESAEADKAHDVVLTLRRSVGDAGPEPIEESDALRSASCLGPSGMAGVVLSPKTL